MYQGTREDGSIIEDNNPMQDKLYKSANEAISNPIKWLNLKEIYGSLTENNTFRESFSNQLNLINKNVVISAVENYLNKL